MKNNENAAGSFWTLQEFTNVGKHPWYALQQHTPDGINRQYTAFRHEMDNLAKALGVAPRLLPATTEAEFWRTYGFDQTKAREPHIDTGVYRGLIVGVNANAVIQEVGPKDLVAHRLDDLDRLPAAGQKVAIQYSHGHGSVRDIPVRELAPKAKGLGR